VSRKQDLFGGLFLSPNDYFKEVVGSALQQRNMRTFPMAEAYLVQLLGQYVNSDNFFEDQEGRKSNPMLAEMFLKAQSTQTMTVKIEMLKRLGDVSLYVSGLFGDSLNRKIVDIDYYADMGGQAYGSLAETIKEDTFRKVFSEYSARFLEFVDVLTLISQKVFLQNNESLLRLYDRYLKTGSELARETLLEKGIISVPYDKEKKKFQQ
jgi:hypothetical protein